jgi:Mg-chelatase subunit ChlD
MLRAAALLLAAHIAGAQIPSQPARRVVHVAVEDGTGRTVPGLTASDFHVLLDSALAPVIEASVSQDPLSVIVLVDATVSAGWRRRPLDRLLTALSRSLRERDRIAVAAFGRRTTIRDFVPGRSDLARTVRRTTDLEWEERHGESPIWDALYEVAQRLDSVPPPRAIVLLTDGRATGNVRGLDEVADAIAGRGIAVHVVQQLIEQQIYQGSGRAVMVRPSAPLRRLARFSGGRDVVYPPRQEDAQQLFVSLGERLTSLYRLTIAVPDAPGLRRLAVSVKRPGLTVRTPMIVQ